MTSDAKRQLDSVEAQIIKLKKEAASTFGRGRKARWPDAVRLQIERLKNEARDYRQIIKRSDQC